MVMKAPIRSDMRDPRNAKFFSRIWERFFDNLPTDIEDAATESAELINQTAGLYGKIDDVLAQLSQFNSYAGKIEELEQEFSLNTQFYGGLYDKIEDLNSIIGSVPEAPIDYGLFLKLSGRPGGQVAYGDTVSSGNLVLRPTTHATKGVISMPDSSATAGTSLDMSGNLELGGFDLAAYDFPLQRGALKAKLIGGLGVHRGYIMFQTPSNLGPALAFIDTAGTNRAYWQQVGTDKSFRVIVNNDIQRMRFYANGEILIGPTGIASVAATVDVKSYFTTQPVLLLEAKAGQTSAVFETRDSANAVHNRFANVGATVNESVLNEQGGDLDLRVETANVTNAFLIDASADQAEFHVNLLVDGDIKGKNRAKQYFFAGF
jgi:hypothetical protein